jgi:hypothetical protein
MRTFRLFFFILGFFLIIPLFNFSLAATLQFDPTTVNTQADQTFEVKINVDAGSDQITSIDAYVLYDSNVLELSSVNDGTFFNTVSKDISQSGKAYIAGMVDDPATSKTGSGTLATIVFRAKSNGSATLTFNCTQGLTTDSNITKNDLNATDLIQCDANGKSVITVGTGSSSRTSQPTSTPSSSSSSSQLPKTGIFDNVLKYSIPGVILLLIGTATKIIL